MQEHDYETDEDASVHDTIASWTEATRPDEPEIREPSPGTVSLYYGLKHKGEVLRDAVVRELRGTDEEALSHLDQRAADYYPRVIDTIVSRATVSIGGVDVDGKMLRSLLIGDRDLLFKTILLATFGDDKEFRGVPCPMCDMLNSFTVNVPDHTEDVPLLDPEKPYTDIPLRNGGTLRVNYPTGDDQFYGYAKKGATTAEVNTRMIERCLGKVPNAREIAENLSLPDRRAIVAALIERPTVRLKEVTVSCSNDDCGENIPFAFGWADLLFS